MIDIDDPISNEDLLDSRSIIIIKLQRRNAKKDRMISDLEQENKELYSRIYVLEKEKAPIKRHLDACKEYLESKHAENKKLIAQLDAYILEIKFLKRELFHRDNNV